MKGFVSSARAVAGMAGIALLGACADRGVVAPRSEQPAAGGNARALLTAGSSDTTVTTFVVLPLANATLTIAGEHKLKIPGGAICDPALSTYGPTEWDKPCVRAVAPVTITAKSWRNAAGRPVVDFSPALRFAETERGAVTLYMMDRVASLDASYTMFYCAKGQCIDESIADPALATRRDAAHGFAYRQLKHFSGYVMGPSRLSAEADAASMF